MTLYCLYSTWLWVRSIGLAHFRLFLLFIRFFGVLFDVCCDFVSFGVWWVVWCTTTETVTTATEIQQKIIEGLCGSVALWESFCNMNLLYAICWTGHFMLFQLMWSKY